MAVDVIRLHRQEFNGAAALDNISATEWRYNALKALPGKVTLHSIISVLPNGGRRFAAGRRCLRAALDNISATEWRSRRTCVRNCDVI